MSAGAVEIFCDEEAAADEMASERKPDASQRAQRMPK
jgi:hypothetical protein